MSDDRNDGSVPPPSAPAAPPPLAGSPPPQPAPQPVPQANPAAAYPPPAGGSNTGKWALFIILAFAAGVGLTILTLWLTGDLWNSRSGYSPPSSYGSGSGTSSYGSPDTNTSTFASTSGGYAPTEASIVGTWGEGCPGSRAGAITFYSDHTVVGDNGQGSWSLSGNYLTANTDRGTNTLYWEMVSGSQARVRRSGSTATRFISRCS